MPFPEGSSSTNEDAVGILQRQRFAVPSQATFISIPRRVDRERERYRVVGELLFCLEKNSRDRGEFSGTEYPVGWVTGALDLDGRERERERDRRAAALLVIKVKPGIRVKETRLFSLVGRKKVGERRRSDGVAISEMAVKINEWKSSLSLSRVAVELGQTVCHASAVGEPGDNLSCLVARTIRTNRRVNSGATFVIVRSPSRKSCSTRDGSFANSSPSDD